MTRPVRFLVIDGYGKEARDELVAGKAGRAADLWRRLVDAERLARSIEGELTAIESLPAALLRAAFGGDR